MWTWRKEWWGGVEHGMGKEGRTIKGGSFAMGGGGRWIPGIVPMSSVGGGGGRGRGRRGRLALALICFSPVLLPLICLSLPLLCIAAFCLRLQRRSKSPSGHREDSCGGFPVQRKEGEAAIEDRLLHRYLEDQLGLVGAMRDYDDDGDVC
ncbi:uncharacterized protein LOC103701307 [Phoenix dactylifera]|uniref:Uncharacterized protein LOC103701307 n=1 Tax=Phoenix dactylifera TaxID=42345 RepID=A0A8B7BMG6_PHODC|nr:uncharacterized protein LOC103701307 [Phoenix dactylifera]